MANAPEGFAEERRSAFTKQLSELLNCYSFDTLTNTPDFILANHLLDYLESLAELTRSRDKWYERGVEGKQ